MHVQPYLFFDGRCEEAVVFYQKTLGAEVTMLMRFQDSPEPPQPGMVTPGNVQVQPSGVPGRFAATAEFGMAGSWPISVEWNGPAGSGSANFHGSVQ